MNILIKLMSIVSLVIAPYIANTASTCPGEGDRMEQECPYSAGKEHCKMDCEKDADGNCVIDSALCAEWMSEGKVDSTACVKMENGKCHMKSDACMNAMMECHKGMEGCKEMGGMKGCKGDMKSCDMDKEECQKKMGGEKDCCKKK